MAHLEKMRGVAWTGAIAQEKGAYSATLQLPAVRRRIAAAKRELTRGIEEVRQYFFKAAGGKIVIAPGSGGGWLWKYADDPVGYEGIAVKDLVADETHIWMIRDVGAGGERLELSCVAHAAPEKVVWRRTNVGDGLAIREGRVFYTLTENIHRGYAVETADAWTGDAQRVILKVADKKVNLKVLRGEGAAVFIQGEDGGKFTLWEAIEATAAKIKLLDKESKVQVAVKEGGWLADGIPAGTLKGWPAPDPLKERVVWAMPAHGWLCTTMWGETILYAWGPEKLSKVFSLKTGCILLGDWGCGCGGGSQPLTAVVFAPDRHVETLLLGEGGAIERKVMTAVQPTPLLTVRASWARSAAGGVKVPYRLAGLAASFSSPKGLLVYGYGAYGMPTNIGRMWNLWGPLLAEGWIIAYAFIRGGGDGGEEWVDAGRREHRLAGIADFEAVIWAARRWLGVPAGRTVIAGRSAGGLLVGAEVSRHRRGGLFGAAFAEVPYVDVLRTTTNPGLPLTTIEYNEFGDPARRLIDFMTIAGLSPIDQVAGRGAPGVFVLARTGGNDTQVLAYEPVKWIWRLREGVDEDRCGKLLGYEADEGHFYSPAADLEARAGDLAILDAWVTQPAVRQKIADISIKVQMARRNNVTRKNNMRKSRKAEGGRRKASRKASRKTRKTRKAGRKH